MGWSSRESPKSTENEFLKVAARSALGTGEQKRQRGGAQCERALCEDVEALGSDESECTRKGGGGLGGGGHTGEGGRENKRVSKRERR